MNASSRFFELHMFRLTSDAGALPADAIRLCCDGFRQYVERETRRQRFAPAIAVGPFVLLVALTLIFGFLSRLGPSLDCFAGVGAWMMILYGLSGRMHWERTRSAKRLKAARMIAWAFMQVRQQASGRQVIELHVRIILNMLRIVVGRLRACLRDRLGLIDPSLIVFLLVPPDAAYA